MRVESLKWHFRMVKRELAEKVFGFKVKVIASRDIHNNSNCSPGNVEIEDTGLSSGKSGSLIHVHHSTQSEIT